VDGSSTFETPDPATGTVLAHLARGTKSDVDRAVASAKSAFPAWSRTDPNERARLLWKAGEAILADLDALARAEAIDVGKTDQ
jgi:aldehyde dehydrogenase (NAD+)/phenylacetaldehyde dehydrogenase